MELNIYNIGRYLSQEVSLNTCKVLYWQKRFNCNEHQLCNAVDKSLEIHGNATAENVIKYL